MDTVTKNINKLDPQLRFMIKLGRQKGTKKIHNLPVEEARKVASEMCNALKLPHLDNITTMNCLVKGKEYIKLRCFSSDFESNKPLFIYYHGGGFVLYDLDSHDTICEHLANELDCHVISVDYRKCPEVKLPTPFIDALDAYNWILSENPLKINYNKVILGGDSVGANMSLYIQKNNFKIHESSALILLYPILDFTLDQESYSLYGEHFFLDTDTIKWFLNKSKPDDSYRIDEFGFLNDKFPDRLPTTYLAIAGCDVLRDEGLQFYNQMKSLNMNVSMDEFKTLPHNFLLKAGKVNSCKKAFQIIIDQIQKQLN